MFRTRRVTVGLLGAIALAAIMTALMPAAGLGTTSHATATKQVKIAFFLGSLANSYQRAQLTGLKAAAAANGGVVAKVFDSKDFTAPTQVAQIQDAITSGSTTRS